MLLGALGEPLSAAAVAEGAPLVRAVPLGGGVYSAVGVAHGVAAAALPEALRGAVGSGVAQPQEEGLPEGAATLAEGGGLADATRLCCGLAEALTAALVHAEALPPSGVPRADGVPLPLPEGQPLALADGDSGAVGLAQGVGAPDAPALRDSEAQPVPLGEPRGEADAARVPLAPPEALLRGEGKPEGESQPVLLGLSEARGGCDAGALGLPLAPGLREARGDAEGAALPPPLRVAHAGAVLLCVALPLSVPARAVAHADGVTLPPPPPPLLLALRACVPDSEEVPLTEPLAQAEARAEADPRADPPPLAVGECDAPPPGLPVARGALGEPLGVA